IGVIGGNGYTICSDQLIKPFEYWILKQLNNSIVRLWDIRSGQEIQVFNGHTDQVWSVEYSPFVIKNSSINSSVISSRSLDNKIRFGDIQSNKNELYVIKGKNQDSEILYLKFLQLKENKKRKSNDDISCGINLIIVRVVV
ncbi:hypothetical protein RFI_14120, partial [Reticulomyxa filosa]